MRFLTFVITIFFFACSKDHNANHANPEGNEFGSGGYGVWLNTGEVELFDFFENPIYDVFGSFAFETGIGDFPADWENHVYDLKEESLANSLDTQFADHLLSRLYLADVEIQKYRKDLALSEVILKQLCRVQWQFNRRVDAAEDVISHYSPGVFQYMIPVANRKEDRVSIDYDHFISLKGLYSQSGLIAHEVVGHMIELTYVVPGQRLSQFDKISVSAETRDIVRALYSKNIDAQKLIYFIEEKTDKPI